MTFVRVFLFNSSLLHVQTCSQCMVLMRDLPVFARFPGKKTNHVLSGMVLILQREVLYCSGTSEDMTVKISRKILTGQGCCCKKRCHHFRVKPSSLKLRGRASGNLKTLRILVRATPTLPFHLFNVTLNRMHKISKRITFMVEILCYI